MRDLLHLRHGLRDLVNAGGPFLGSSRALAGDAGDTFKAGDGIVEGLSRSVYQAGAIFDFAHGVWSVSLTRSGGDFPLVQEFVSFKDHDEFFANSGDPANEAGIGPAGAIGDSADLAGRNVQHIGHRVYD